MFLPEQLGDNAFAWVRLGFFKQTSYFREIRYNSYQG